MIKIVVDVMGTDKGPEPFIAAAAQFLNRHTNVFLSLVGNEYILKQLCSKYSLSPKTYELIPTTQVIEPGEGIMSFRRKKNSSMSVALQQLNSKKKEYAFCLSGGSTAAYVAACHFIIGELPQISRPGYMAMMPTSIKNKFVVMLDLGANLENTPEDLFFYAILGHWYMQKVFGYEKPRIGLLNIGAEESKGHPWQKKANQLLRDDKLINFLGNVEPTAILSGEYEVIITDGYTGNIALKSIEGASQCIVKIMRHEFTKNLGRKLRVALIQNILADIKAYLNYKKYAGAIVMGARQLVMKAHGECDEESILSALEIGLLAHKNNFITTIEKFLDTTENWFAK